MEYCNTIQDCKYEGMKNKGFLERLDKCLKDRNWSKYRLAQEISGDFSGIGTPGFYNTINSWYRNEGKYPSIENMVILADTLNVSVDYLLGRHDMTSVDSEYIYKQLGITDKSQEKLKFIEMFRSFESDEHITILYNDETKAINPIDCIDILNLFVMDELNDICESLKDYYNLCKLISALMDSKNPGANYNKIRKGRMNKEICKGKLYSSFNKLLENIDKCF